MSHSRDNPSPVDGSAAVIQRAKRIRRMRRRRRIPPMSVFPTLCTLGNLVAGFAAIHYAARPLEQIGPWGWTGLTFAAVLVFLGMMLDAIDGSLARLTNSTSELGAQVDSLADMVTFGIAPAFMAVQLVGNYLTDGTAVVIIGPEADTIFGRIIWGIAAVYVCCAALRLARFNVETPSGNVVDHMIFRGLPSPGAAGAVASLILLHQHIEASYDETVVAFIRTAAMVVPFIVLLCAFAMVSSMPYAHVVNRYFRGQRSFRYVAVLVVVLVLLIWNFQWVMAITLCGYALSAPTQQLWRLIRRRRGAAR